MSTNIYILKLENDKYYIGRTNDVNFQLEKHFNGGESLWTKKYRPISIIKFITNCSSFDEDKYTLEYMHNYGIKNVRGGSFCEFTMDKNMMNIITKAINRLKNKCPYKLLNLNVSKQFVKDPQYLEMSFFNSKFVCYHHDFKNLLGPLTHSIIKIYVDNSENRIVKKPYIEKDMFQYNSNVIINRNRYDKTMEIDIDDIAIDYLRNIFDVAIKIMDIESYFYRSTNTRLRKSLEEEWNTENIISKKNSNKFLVIEINLCQKLWISNVIYE